MVRCRHCGKAMPSQFPRPLCQWSPTYRCEPAERRVIAPPLTFHPPIEDEFAKEAKQRDR